MSRGHNPPPKRCYVGPVEEQLNSYRAEVEAAVTRGMKGIAGPFLKDFLPQVWIFETEKEIVSFVIDTKGKAIVEGREWRPRDVTVKWKEAFLVSVLKARSRAGIPEGEVPETACHTKKGCAALSFLRSRIGL